jgi:RNA polymerase sigma-70 factor (ECF subfamily)
LAQESATTRLAELFDSHSPHLYRLARRLSGDADQARDLVQDTYLKAARYAERIPPGESAAQAWLVRILINTCRDHWRRQEVRRQAIDLPRPGPAGPNPESAAVARATVTAALATLPPRRRAVIVLHHLEEMETTEIASLLGISQVTVRWHLSAARRQLARQLTPEAGRKS